MTHVRVVAPALAQAAFEKTAAYMFAGKIVEPHRSFLFSAGLVAESSVTPWSAVPEWHDHGTALVEFMVGQTGPADVLVFCDGRSRTCRAKLEEMTKSMRHPSEVWVVYKPSPRLGRKVTFASDNREVLLVSLPVPRVLLPVKERREFAGRAKRARTTRPTRVCPPCHGGGCHS